MDSIRDYGRIIGRPKGPTWDQIVQKKKSYLWGLNSTRVNSDSIAYNLSRVFNRSVKYKL